MIETATTEQVREVAFNMRGRDFEELRATSFCATRDELADELARRYGGRDDVMCGSLNGEPVYIGGTIETWPGVMSLLFFATPEFRRCGLEATRFITRQLFPRYERAGIHRIQAVSLEGYAEVHAWLETLGLKREAVLPRFGKDGQDFVQFGRLANVRPAA